MKCPNADFSIQLASRLKLSFAVPRGFRAQRGPSGANTIVLRRAGSDSRMPDLLVTLSSPQSFGSTLASALEQQKRLSKSDPSRRLKACRHTRIAGFACGLIECYDRQLKIHEATYMRLVGETAIVCGYRYRARALRCVLDIAARRIVRSIRLSGRGTDTATAPAADNGAALHKAGLSIPLPDGWERQELLGQTFAFAPGKGFRARICVSVHSGRDDRQANLEADLEVLDITQAVQRQLCSRGRFGKARSREHPVGRCLMYAFSGRLKRNEVDTRGRVVLLSTSRGRALIVYQAQAGADFTRFEPNFEQTVNGVCRATRRK